MTMNTRKKYHQKWSTSRILQDVLVGTQLMVFSALGIVLAIMLGNPHSPQRISNIAYTSTKVETGTNVQSSKFADPSLEDLLATVVDAFDELNISYWLLPGTQLLPSQNTRKESKISGKLSPWQEGIDIGVMAKDQMLVLLAQSRIQSAGVASVESYFGMRFFSLYGKEDERYDFRTPLVDVMYFDNDDEYIVNSCCDCQPITISACTKKTCGCMFCAAKKTDIFPTISVEIDECRRSIAAPQNVKLVFLSEENQQVHPSVFKAPSLEFI